VLFRSLDLVGEAISLAKTLTAEIPKLNTAFFEEHIRECSEYAEKDFDFKVNSLKLLHLLCD
jgi:hypothetical protein